LEKLADVYTFSPLISVLVMYMAFKVTCLEKLCKHCPKLIS